MNISERYFTTKLKIMDFKFPYAKTGLKIETIKNKIILLVDS